MTDVARVRSATGRWVKMSPEALFWAKVDERGPDDCWPWTAALVDGYGSFGWERTGRRAHRIAYELMVGPIPEGKELDHLCHTRALSTCPGGPDCLHRRCVNPAHLEPVTKAVNTSRGQRSASALNAVKTHCPAGHPYTPDNLVASALPTRRCKVCRSAEGRAYAARKRKPHS